MRFLRAILTALLVTALHAAEKLPAETMITIRAAQYPASQIEKAYEQVREQVAYDRARSKLSSLKDARAVVLSGKVKQRLGAKRVVLESVDGALRVVDARSVMKENQIVKLVVRARGSYSLRVNGARTKAELYQDLTLSAEEFLTLLRRGEPFPGLKGLASTTDDIFRNNKQGVDPGKAALQNPRHKTGFKRRTTRIK